MWGGVPHNTTRVAFYNAKLPLMLNLILSYPMLCYLTKSNESIKKSSDSPSWTLKFCGVPWRQVMCISLHIFFIYSIILAEVSEHYICHIAEICSTTKSWYMMHPCKSNTSPHDDTRLGTAQKCSLFYFCILH